MKIIFGGKQPYLFHYFYLLILIGSSYLIHIYISFYHYTGISNADKIKKIKKYERAVIVLYLNVFFPGSGSLMLGLSKLCDKDENEDNRIRRIKNVFGRI